MKKNPIIKITLALVFTTLLVVTLFSNNTINGTDQLGVPQIKVHVSFVGTTDCLDMCVDRVGIKAYPDGGLAYTQWKDYVNSTTDYVFSVGGQFSGTIWTNLDHSCNVEIVHNYKTGSWEQPDEIYLTIYVDCESPIE